MKVRRYALTVESLCAVSPEERSFLLMAGHMQNELHSLNKVFVCMLAADESSNTSSLEHQANGLQAMIYARILAGKLLECWEALRTVYFGSRLSRTYARTIPAEAGASLGRLKRYFGRPNLIHDVRNGFAFHYDARAFERHWREAAEESNFDFILGGANGNNLYLASEIVANLAMLETIAVGKREEALNAFFSEIQLVAKQLCNFLDGVMLPILERCLGPDILALSVDEEIFPARSLSDVSLPFFFRTPDLPPQSP